MITYKVLNRRNFLCASALAPSFVMAATSTARADNLLPPQLNETAPMPFPELDFAVERGSSIGLKTFRGKFILLNIWATWCAPCREEMPTLDRLQSKLGGPHFQVVPLSIDTGGVVSVRQFYNEIGIKHLGIYLDTTGDIMQVLNLEGIPTTFLITPDGRQIGQLAGAADWDSPSSLSFFKRTMAAA
ncbi:MAG TPA: TlpA disulfide reductase family protein [Acidocella sp.]|uniref:TlpA family protein disulfide reductase n=1 Tax=Acidiphilium sp. 20-67-58 TaxID=1970291 RepID=UPI000BD22FC4|nr:TlpA disulfide reductase family protein [Acidiphilium sp. 20-67-58]OYV54816.1 MAG: thiol:disulfide interchange protein [Acidiphilium sp. 20-67-58]HQT37881.1 TlpA disulfide reductase family protein [Acidocella sp.]